jgi:hypothetical protein
MLKNGGVGPYPESLSRQTRFKMIPSLRLSVGAAIFEILQKRIRNTVVKIPNTLYRTYNILAWWARIECEVAKYSFI